MGTYTTSGLLYKPEIGETNYGALVNANFDAIDLCINAFKTESVYFNTLAGGSAGAALTIGANNLMLGYQAGLINTTGSYNIFAGYQSGKANITGGYNMFIGAGSGVANTASNNVFIGYASGAANTSGNQNMFLGIQSGSVNTTGLNNTYIGYQAGFAGNTSNGVYLGYFAGKYETLSSKLFIDSIDRTDEATARTNSLIYGLFDATPANQILRLNAKVGIGMAPTYTLDITGDVNVTGIFRINGEGLGGVSGVTGMGNAGRITKWTAADTLSDSVIYEDSSKIGIGTATPDNLLQVNSAASPTASQMKVTANDTGALSQTVLGPDSSFIGWDVDYSGSAYVARDTSAFMIMKASDILRFYADTSLTSGNSYTPTLVMVITPSGKLLLAGASEISSYKLVVNGAGYFVQSVSAESYTDRTPSPPEGMDAIAAINNISSIDGEIDHSSLPEFARKQVMKSDGSIEEQRDIGSMLSVVTLYAQQNELYKIGIEARLTALEQK